MLAPLRRDLRLILTLQNHRLLGQLTRGTPISEVNYIQTPTTKPGFSRKPGDLTGLSLVVSSIFILGGYDFSLRTRRFFFATLAAEVHI